MTLPFSIVSDADSADHYRRVAERLARLQALTAALARTRTTAEIADVILSQAFPALGTPFGVVAVLSDDGTSLRNVLFEGVSSEAEERVFPLDAVVPTAEAVRLGCPVIVTTLEERNRRYPCLARLHGHAVGGAVTAHPLIVDGRLVGALGFCFSDSRAFDDDDRAFLQTLADQCALAVDRAQRTERLHDAARRKDEFIAMLAHELRNPLGPIRNAVQVLRKLGLTDPRAVMMRETIDRQSAQMGRLVDDLLDVSRLTRGSLVLRRAPLDLVALVRATTDDHRPTIEAAGLRFGVAVPSRPLWIVADGTRLAQAIANLLHNSQKFTEAGGEIRIALIEDGGMARIEVSDTGIGLRAEVLAGIFTPFAHANRRADRVRGGLGLGLALVKGLVERHGGTILAESDGPGRGAKFTIQLSLTTVDPGTLPPL